MDYELDDAQLQGLYRFAVTLTQEREDAYDLLQSAVESYLIKVKQGQDDIENTTAYLRTLIRHKFIDHYRYHQRWQNETYIELDLYDISPINLEEVTITSNELESVWGQLGANERAILYYWGILGYSTDEACDLLGLPRGTFLARLHRLRKRLKKRANQIDSLVRVGS